MTQIVRGTTPTIIYRFGKVDVANIVVAYLTIKQGGTLLIEKTLSDALVGEATLSWVLTQAETLSPELGDATCMVNWKLADGTRGVSPRTAISIVENDKEVVI